MPGKNINQIAVTTTLQNTDKLYLGRSPFSSSDDYSITWANILADINKFESHFQLDLQTDPDYQITNPMPSWIEITASDPGSQFRLPEFNTTDSYPAGKTFFITNNTGNDISMKGVNGITDIGTLKAGQIIIGNPINNSNPYNLNLIVQAYSINDILIDYAQRNNNLSDLNNLYTAVNNLRLHRSDISVNLATNPGYQLTNPMPTAISITNANSGITDGTVINLPDLTEANANRPGSYFIILNYTNEVITIRLNGSAWVGLQPNLLLFGYPTSNDGINNNGDANSFLLPNNFTTILAEIRGTVANMESTSHTFTATDCFNTHLCTENAAITITLPTDSTENLRVNSWANFVPTGTGQITFVGEDGTVNIRSANDAKKSRVQYSPVTIRKIASNTFLLEGDLTT